MCAFVLADGYEGTDGATAISFGYMVLFLDYSNFKYFPLKYVKPLPIS